MPPPTRVRWQIRYANLKKAGKVDTRAYPGAETGTPSKSTRDKIRRHEKATARALAWMGDHKVVRGRRARVDEINRIAWPKGVLRPKSLKVAFVPSAEPDSITRVTVRKGSLIVHRTRFKGTPSAEKMRDVHNPLTRKEIRRILTEPGGLRAWAEKKFAADEKRGSLFRMDLLSGRSVGSGLETMFHEETDLENLLNQLENLEPESGDPEGYLAGVSVIEFP